VLPHEVALLPVGGITPVNMRSYRDAGASGFGSGSALYSPGATVDDVARRAQAFVEAWRF
jgi:2-dehydro-3-deoxyphosphogalactonate aldolase